LIDARKLRDVALPQQAIIKGDTKSLTIAAASILAKTARDARMRAFDGLYPGYGFAQHKGYPVRAHFRALRRLGACPIHRRSFGIVRQVLGLPPLPPWPVRSGLDPTAVVAAIEAGTDAAE
jgi:ribonuclease HII